MPRGIFAAALLACSCAGAWGHREGLAAAVHARQLALQASWARELARGAKNPVQRVVKLLEKMKEQLEEEKKAETATYEKMVCWCETTEKEKTKSADDAEAKEAELRSDVEAGGAHSGELSTEIERLKAQIGEDTDALNKVTGIREREAAAFRKEEKEMVQVITGLRNAITVLDKTYKSSFLQLGTPLVSGLQVVLREAANRRELMLADAESSHGEQHPQQPADADDDDGGPDPFAFLALSARRGRAGEQQESALEAALRAALNPQGPGVPDLPLNFAESMVERSARSFPKAQGVLLQTGERQPSSSGSSVYGTLQQMLEEFQDNLKLAQETEKQAIEDYEEMSQAKKKQIAVAQQKLDDFEQDNSSNEKARTEAKEELDATREQLAADKAFLANMRKTCRDLDHDWEQRKVTRLAELKAVTEAVGILTSDDSLDQLAETMSFVQVRAERRGRAALALQQAAQDASFDTDDLMMEWGGRRNGPNVPVSLAAAAAAAAGLITAAPGPRAQLSALASAVKIDSFHKVKEMMDVMVEQLKETQDEEVDIKASCKKELQANEKALFAKRKEKKGLDTDLQALASDVERLEKDIKEAKATMAETNKEISKASQAREEENAEFQTLVSGQRASQTILKKALLRLEDFYKKGIGKKALFVQLGEQLPEQVASYKANSGASPVMGLLSQIIADSEQLVAEASASERKAQEDYESFVKDSNALIKQFTDAVTRKTKAIGDAKLDTAETESELESTKEELEDLETDAADLHEKCDWLLKNFDIRQKARLEEIEAIHGAKAILSGAQTP